MPLLWSLMKLVHFYAITFRPYGTCELHQSLTYTPTAIDLSYILVTNIMKNFLRQLWCTHQSDFSSNKTLTN